MKNLPPGELFSDGADGADGANGADGADTEVQVQVQVQWWTTLRARLSAYGPLHRFVTPRIGFTALVEFHTGTEARNAFRALAYARVRTLPSHSSHSSPPFLPPYANSCTISYSLIRKDFLYSLLHILHRVFRWDPQENFPADPNGIPYCTFRST